MKKIILSAIIAISLVSCLTDVEGSKKALIESGYHPIEVGGYGFFSGGKGDTFVTKFKAYSPDSTHIVTGVVCRGLLKGKTIRLD
jgi:hypothetical protein